MTTYRYLITHQVGESRDYASEILGDDAAKLSEEAEEIGLRLSRENPGVQINETRYRWTGSQWNESGSTLHFLRPAGDQRFADAEPGERQTPELMDPEDNAEQLALRRKEDYR